MKIALCTDLRNVEWFESRLRSLFDGDGQLAIDELWNENQLAQALRRSRYHAVVMQGCLDAGISPQQFYDADEKYRKAYKARAAPVPKKHAPER